jgi:hypothetical protein
MYTWSFRHPCGHRTRASLFIATAARTGGARVRRVVTRRRRGGPALATRRAATGTAETRRAFAVQSGDGLQTRTNHNPRPERARKSALLWLTRGPAQSHPEATNGARGRSGGNRRVNERVGPSVCVYISIIYRYAHRRSSSRALRPNGTISALLQRRVYPCVLTGVLQGYSQWYSKGTLIEA